MWYFVWILWTLLSCIFCIIVALVFEYIETGKIGRRK